MKKDYRLCAFMIARILLPRRRNHAQLTTEDICLIHALKESIQTDWAKAIFDNRIKVTRPDIASLPYVVFISQVLVHCKVEFTDEATQYYNKKNMAHKSTLHHMGLRRSETGWVFIDEHQHNMGEEVDPLNASSSTTASSFRPKNEFERNIVRQIHTLISHHNIYQSRFDKLDQEIATIQQKLGNQNLDDEEEENNLNEGETDANHENGSVKLIFHRAKTEQN
ncbi:hypothetical protein V8G54_036873 [Vigna mungo]|uniref:Uncharacterized protein n=1 Tax=Vigna mungo TaxID=3915 RepID=A0AAQ3MHJ4_VIGMU